MRGLARRRASVGTLMLHPCAGSPLENCSRCRRHEPPITRYRHDLDVRLAHSVPCPTRPSGTLDLNERSRRPTARAARRLPGVAAPLRRIEARSSVAPQRPLHDSARAGRGLRPRNEQRRVRRPRLPRRRPQPVVHRARATTARPALRGRRRPHRRGSRRGTYDFVLVNSLLHHLDDDSVSSLLADLRRYVSSDGHIHVIDLELPERRGIPRALALGDRGDYPRSLQSWRDPSDASTSTQTSSSAFPFRPAGRCYGAWSTSKEARRPMAEPRVSVAIAVHNEEAVFPELVRRLVGGARRPPGRPARDGLRRRREHRPDVRPDRRGSRDRPARRRRPAVAQLRPPGGADGGAGDSDGRRRHRHGRRPPGPSGGDPSVRRRVREGLRRRLRAAGATGRSRCRIAPRTSSSTA